MIYPKLDDLTQEVIRKASERPELAGLHTTFRSTTPQLRADVDRDKATLLGVQLFRVDARGNGITSLRLEELARERFEFGPRGERIVVPSNQVKASGGVGCRWGRWISRGCMLHNLYGEISLTGVHGDALAEQFHQISRGIDTQTQRLCTARFVGWKRDADFPGTIQVHRTPEKKSIPC